MDMVSLASVQSWEHVLTLAFHRFQTAWVKPGTKPTIGIIRDFVSPEFSDFLALLVDEYSTIGFTDTQCGYACSDHVRPAACAVLYSRH